MYEHIDHKDLRNTRNTIELYPLTHESPCINNVSTLINAIMRAATEQVIKSHPGFRCYNRHLSLLCYEFKQIVL
jgi:hypothetical protein